MNLGNDSNQPAKTLTSDSVIPTKAPSTDKKIPAKNLPTAESLYTDTEIPAKNLSNDDELPTEKWQTESKLPAKKLKTDTELPAKDLETDTELSVKYHPTDNETHATNMRTNTEIPVENLQTDTKLPANNLPTDTKIPTDSLPVHSKKPAKNQPANSKVPENSLPVENDTANSPTQDFSVSDSQLPFPDASKEFYRHQGRSWARHEARDRARDATPITSNKAGFTVLRRGNVTGSLHENIEHLSKQLRIGKNKEKQAIKYGVIKVAANLEESMVLSTREAALLYNSEKNSFLGIKDGTKSSYRAIDTYQLLSNHLNVAQMYICGIAYLFDAHGRDLNQISNGIFS